MDDKFPCRLCGGLGFRSIDDRHTYPEFNVYGLTRHHYPGGKVLWEGDCIECRGTGFVKPPFLCHPEESKLARLMKLCGH